MNRNGVHFSLFALLIIFSLYCQLSSKTSRNDRILIYPFNYPTSKVMYTFFFNYVSYSLPAATAVLFVPFTVFRNNIAMVIGPTPPGTGVILDATSLAFSKSTSPTKR